MKKSLSAFILVFAIIISAFSFGAYAADMQNGTYEVDIALWHSEDDKASMAADAVGKKATIVVENGTKTMHITSGEMSMMGIKASLQELKIADASGNYTDAKIESKNSEGNPTGFYFTMPHTDEYITVKVNPHIAIMGNKDIGARIKVDYSTLKLVKAADDITETIAATTTGISGENVAETSSAAEELTDTVYENTTVAEETEAISENTTASVRTDSPAQDNTAVIIAIAVIAAAAVIFAIVKIKRK